MTHSLNTLGVGHAKHIPLTISHCFLGRVSDGSTVDRLCLFQSFKQHKKCSSNGKIQEMMQKFFMFKQAYNLKMVTTSKEHDAFLSLFVFILRRSEDDSWISNGTYWAVREDPGFSRLDFPVLW